MNTALRDHRLRLGYFYQMADILKPCSRGNAAIDTFEITKDTWQGFGVEKTRPGTYARLRVNGSVMMSDTDMELRTNVGAVIDAKGDVLIGGLGLGAIVLPIVAKKGVRSVTVVEKNEHVIALVEDQLRAQMSGTQSAGFLVWHGDIHTWRPVKANVRRFDYIYFDIWQELSTDRVAEMKALHLAFRPYLRKGGKVTSWEYERLRTLERQGRWR